MTDAVTPDTIVLEEFLTEFPDAQIIRCNTDKTPYRGDYRKEAPPVALSDLVFHIDTCGKLGIVPGSVNCAAIDIDHGGERRRTDTEQRLTTEDTDYRVVPTRREGGYHIFVGSEGPIPNFNWEGGEVRCTAGYVVMHHLSEVLTALTELAGTTTAVTETQLRQILPPRAEGDTGGRNNTLNKEYYYATLEGDGKRQAETIQTARDAGLPQKEIEKTVRSATKAAEKKQTQPTHEPVILSETTDNTATTGVAIYPGAVARGELGLTAGESGSRKTTFVIGSFLAALKDNPGLTCAWFCSDATQAKSKDILESAGFQWSKQIAFYAWKPPKKGELDSQTLKLTIERAKAKFGRLDMVVLDSIGDILLMCGDAFLQGDREVNLNTQPHCTKGMSWLATVAAEYQVAMELICHPSKGSPTSAPFHSTLPQHAEISRFTYSLNQQDFAEKKVLNKTVMAAWLSHGAEHLLHIKKNRGGKEGKYFMEFGNGAVILNEMTKPKGKTKVDYESRILEYIHEQVEQNKLLPRTVHELALGVGGKTAMVKATANRMLKRDRDGTPSVLTIGACCRHIHNQVQTCIHVCEH